MGNAPIVALQFPQFLSGPISSNLKLPQKTKTSNKIGNIAGNK